MHIEPASGSWRQYLSFSLRGLIVPRRVRALARLRTA